MKRKPPKLLLLVVGVSSIAGTSPIGAESISDKLSSEIAEAAALSVLCGDLEYDYESAMPKISEAVFDAAAVVRAATDKLHGIVVDLNGLPPKEACEEAWTLYGPEGLKEQNFVKRK